MGNYCLALSLPLQAQHKADLVMAGMLTMGAAAFTEGTFWPHDAVTWVALIGGVVGVMVGAVRLWRMVAGGYGDR
jgi:hypothetical protein